jgi:hypothetical protein
MAEAKDCILTKAATDDERMSMLKQWAKEGKGYEHERDSRTIAARRQLTEQKPEMSDFTQNMPENAGLDDTPCPISHKTTQFGKISAVSRISIGIEMGGRPYFVVLPHEGLLLLLNLAASMSDGGQLKVTPAPEGFHFKTL